MKTKETASTEKQGQDPGILGNVEILTRTCGGKRERVVTLHTRHLNFMLYFNFSACGDVPASY